ncbi:NAD(P)-dependent oxidoreductase [Variovorax sp. KK3]|uniref:NAD(P)-dependent oxidoreductase n=1 Tax=Variovorax sp. KK3 TaxID=1855728 RepID=UPI00097C2D34|nr:NAD(P)-dependent oxidoreductase [Variovorax sp. KK3]
MDIGIIGLGAMGSAMAKNIVAAGHRVNAWTRSGGSVVGVTMLGDPREVFDADAVLTMLSDDDAIRGVILDTEVLASARPGVVHVVSSTISLAFARELESAHQAAGVGFVSAPVLGRPDVAARGELNVLVSGAPAEVERVRPLLEAISRRIWPLGDDAPAANAAKIACNMMIAMAIEAMAEAVVLTEAQGVPRERFFELILGTLFDSRPYRTYSANISAGAYQPGFKAELGLKDLRLATQAASAANRTLPMLEATRARMQDAVDAGWGEQDWSAMAKFTIENGQAP